MYDIKSRNFFKKSDAKSRVATWWESVNPFWSTAAGAGKKVAFFNWHDCQIPGTNPENGPSDCLPYPSIGPSNGSLINSYDSNSQFPFIPSHTSIGQQADAAFTKIHKDKYDISIVSLFAQHLEISSNRIKLYSWCVNLHNLPFSNQIYTDIIRRNAEQYGPESDEVHDALHDVDDILQAKLTDLEAKKGNADLEVCDKIA